MMTMMLVKGVVILPLCSSLGTAAVRLENEIINTTKQPPNTFFPKTHFKAYFLGYPCHCYCYQIYTQNISPFYGSGFMLLPSFDSSICSCFVLLKDIWWWRKGQTFDLTGFSFQQRKLNNNNL